MMFRILVFVLGRSIGGFEGGSVGRMAIVLGSCGFKEVEIVEMFCFLRRGREGIYFGGTFEVGVSVDVLRVLRERWFLCLGFWFFIFEEGVCGMGVWEMRDLDFVVDRRFGAGYGEKVFFF